MHPSETVPHPSWLHTHLPLPANAADLPRFFAPAPTGAAPGTSLDPEETTYPRAPSGVSPHAGIPTEPPLNYDEPAPASDQGFRHSRWFAQRRRVWEALYTVHGPGPRLTRFDCCGTDAWVLHDPLSKDRYRVVADYCHDRFCHPCAIGRSRTIAANLRFKVADRVHRFITLTLHSTNEPLNQLLTKLYRCFARLRRSTLWRHAIDGGAAFCEVAYNRDKCRWHPHLHVIASGRYLEVGHLSQLWRQITRDSHIVDIRLIRDREQCVDYITKYASKPLGQSYAHDHDLLCEAIAALHGRRLCLTFGNWSGVCLTTVDDSTEWKRIESLAVLRSKAAAGDLKARRIFALLGREDAWLETEPPDPHTWDQ